VYPVAAIHGGDEYRIADTGHTAFRRLAKVINSEDFLL